MVTGQTDWAWRTMMRSFVLAAAAFLAAVSLTPAGADAAFLTARGFRAASDLVSPIEPAGCYRLGETGYHWYRWCLGPSWLYPHRRICHDGYCQYR